MRLEELRRSMHAYATRFDAGRISAQDAAKVVDDAMAIENMAASVKALAAARVAETNLWKRDGDRSAAHQLARTTGTSVHQANETLQAGRRLQDLPGTAEAARRGELSPQQVAVIPTPPAPIRRRNPRCWTGRALPATESCATSAPAPKPTAPI